MEEDQKVIHYIRLKHVGSSFMELWPYNENAQIETLNSSSLNLWLLESSLWPYPLPFKLSKEKQFWAQILIC